MPRHTRHKRGWDADERETRVEIAFLHRNASLLWVRLSQAGLVFPFSHCVRFRAYLVFYQNTTILLEYEQCHYIKLSITSFTISFIRRLKI
jgi:hypothetical protein